MARHTLKILQHYATKTATIDDQLILLEYINPLNVNPTKWSNTFKFLMRCMTMVSLGVLNPFQAIVQFLYLLKTSENLFLMFSGSPERVASNGIRVFALSRLFKNLLLSYLNQGSDSMNRHFFQKIS